MNTTDFGDRPDAADELAEAAHKFAGAGERPALQLEAVLNSLMAALRLLREDHEWSQLAPLQYLCAGLSRLAAGRPDPVLKPLREKKKAGKSPVSDGAMIYKQVWILLSHEVLLRGRWKRGEADRRVAELATAAGFKSFDGKSLTGHTVRGWRSLVSTPEMRPVREQLEAYTEMLSDTLDAATVEVAAEQMLNHAASIFAGIEISRDPALL